MSDMPVVEKTKPVFIAWTNTDCTEGRGQQVPKAVSFSQSCAVRLGRRGSVQGTDCHVTEGIAVQLKGIGGWLTTARIHEPTRDDEEGDTRIAAKLRNEQRKQEALERAKAAGLSEEDIKALSGIE